MHPTYLIDSVAEYLHARKKLKRFDGMSIDELHRACEKQLLDIVGFAWEKVPFYRHKWSEAGIKPDDIRSVSDFESLPLIDRNDIIEHCDEFIPSDYDRRHLSRITTGGTSGMPMQFYIDNYRARAKEVAFVETINRKYFGCKPFDRQIMLRGDRVVDDEALRNYKFWKYSFIKRALALSSFHLSQDNFASYMAKIRSYDPHVIKAYPSSIGALCSLMKQNGEKPLKSLRAVICSSENISELQRKLVRQVLGVEIWSYYGHSEKCVAAFQGKDGKMLFHPLYGYTEFVDAESGRVVTSPGQTAEVVVTGFNHDYFPLIRYRTNDLVEIGKPEGLFEKTAVRILGREQDFVYDNALNKKIFTNSDEPFWELDGVTAYQYVQDKPGEMTVRLQVSDRYELSTEERILSGINEVFPGFIIRFEYVNDIPKTARGKFKFLIQNLKI